MEHNPFIALLLITLLALVIPLLLGRFGSLQLPIVVGEIVAGVIIGSSGFNLVEPSATLDFLAEFGFAFLMFLSGLEVDFTLLLRGTRGGTWREKLTRPLATGTFILVLTLSLAIAITSVLAQFGILQSPILMGLILSTTSMGIVAPVLKERHLLGKQYGQVLLVAATLADFVTLLLLTVVIAVRSQGLTFDLLLLPVLLVAFVLVVRIGQSVVRIKWLNGLVDSLPHATAQIKVRGALALLVAFVVLAEALGAELILGAFLAGAIAKLISDRGTVDVHDKLDAIGYGFFIPIFFIMVGVNLHISSIVESPDAILLIPLLIAAAFIVKVIPSLVFRLQYSWRETLAGGFLLSSRLSLIIAASAIALEIGAITAAVEADIIIIATVTCVISPLIFNSLFKAKDEKARHGVIIIGSDQMTELVARRLYEHRYRDITIVSRNRARLHEFQLMGTSIINGHPGEIETLRSAGAETAESLLVLTQDPLLTFAVCSMAQETFGIPNIVAGVAEISTIQQLQHMDVRVVQPALATAMALEGALRFPTAFDVLTHQSGEDVEIAEVILRNRQFTGIPLHQISLPGNAVLLSVKREHIVIVPNGDTVLSEGDHIALLGSPESIADAVLCFS